MLLERRNLRPKVDACDGKKSECMAKSRCIYMELVNREEAAKNDSHSCAAGSFIHATRHVALTHSFTCQPTGSIEKQSWKECMVARIAKQKAPFVV